MEVRADGARAVQRRDSNVFGGSSYHLNGTVSEVSAQRSRVTSRGQLRHAVGSAHCRAAVPCRIITITTVAPRLRHNTPYSPVPAESNCQPLPHHVTLGVPEKSDYDLFSLKVEKRCDGFNHCFMTLYHKG